MRIKSTLTRRLAGGALALAVGSALAIVGAVPAVAGGEQSGGVEPLVDTQCSPNSSYVNFYSSYKSGKVTKWSKHIKNDSTFESFNWSTATTGNVKASASYTAAASGSVTLKKLASIELGTTTNIGLQGEWTQTQTYTRYVEFNQPGKWVIYAGHYTATGSYTAKKCNSMGTGYSKSGSGTAFTFKDARITGLHNCAYGASDLVAKDAKTKC